jgi:hypothetical protein
VHIRVTIIKSEITFTSKRGSGVGSQTEKGGIGEAAGCSASERHNSHRGSATGRKVAVVGSGASRPKAVQRLGAGRTERCKGRARA